MVVCMSHTIAAAPGILLIRFRWDSFMKFPLITRNPFGFMAGCRTTAVGQAQAARSIRKALATTTGFAPAAATAFILLLTRAIQALSMLNLRTALFRDWR